MSKDFKLSRDVVEEILKKAQTKEELVSYELEHVSTNFCDLKRLTVQLKSQDGGGNEQCKFIVKHAPIGRNDGNDLYRDRAFKKEAFFYSTLAPIMNDCLKSKGQSPLKIPRFYYHNCNLDTDCQDNSEDVMIVVLEDLNERGFETSRNWAVDEQHTKLVFEEMARFHSASYLIQDDQVQLVDRFPLLFESFMMKGYCDGLEKMFQDGTKTMASLCDDAPHLDKLKSWLLRMEPHSFGVITKQLIPKAPYSTICHSDLHANNVLFRYSSSGEPVEVVLVDFQVIRVMPFAIDLNYFSYLSVMSSTRDRILPSVLSGYYNQMSDILADKMPFSIDTLVSEVNNNDTGLLYGILMLPFAIAFMKSLDKTDSLHSNSRQQQMFSVIKELGEEANKRKIYEKYNNIKDFMYQFI